VTGVQTCALPISLLCGTPHGVSELYNKLYNTNPEERQIGGV